MAEDREITAIASVIQALEPLDGEAQDRVLEYVFKRLGRGIPRKLVRAPLSDVIADQSQQADSATAAIPEGTDIRTLKDQKQPKSANEMAALVAYYLSELAPQNERADTIGTTEVEKYFKQAKYPLPQVTRNTLSNAASAGYFDSAGRGQYRLNPVGYNLVVHSLPSAAEGAKRNSPHKKSSSARKKSSKKPRKTTRTKKNSARPS
jgi:hypothetical protein